MRVMFSVKKKMKEVPAQFDLIGMDLLAVGNIINCQLSLKFELGCVQLL